MYVALSALVHILLLWPALTSRRPDPIPPERVELEVLVQPAPISQGRSQAKTIRRFTRSLKLKGSVQNFDPRHWRDADEPNRGGMADLAAAYEPNSPWGAGSAHLKMIELYIPLDRLRLQTDGATHYPGVLAYHDITGDSSARLVIAHTGCDWRHTQVWASERHLRLYILHVLKKVCSLEDVKRIGTSQPINVDFAFSFRQTEDALVKDSSALRGNVIVVQRWYKKSIAEWHVGPLRGMFPIPAVSVDFIWLKEHWDEYVEKKGRFDEFDRDYRESP